MAGKKNHEEQTSASDLFRQALQCADKGEIVQAETLYRAAVEKYERLYDDEYEIPPAILASLGNLAFLYADTGRYDMEARTLEKALGHCREFAEYDENFLPRVIECQNDLALSYSRQGLYRLAEDNYRGALAVNAKTVTAWDGSISESALSRSAVLHNNLAVLYETKIKDPARAGEQYREMLEDFGGLYRLNRDLHAEALKNTLVRAADFFRSEGQAEKAKELQDEAQAVAG